MIKVFYSEDAMAWNDCIHVDTSGDANIEGLSWVLNNKSKTHVLFVY